VTQRAAGCDADDVGINEVRRQPGVDVFVHDERIVQHTCIRQPRTTVTDTEFYCTLAAE